jgi:hypothetical protein
MGENDKNEGSSKEQGENSKGGVSNPYVESLESRIGGASDTAPTSANEDYESGRIEGLALRSEYEPSEDESSGGARELSEGATNLEKEIAAGGHAAHVYPTETALRRVMRTEPKDEAKLTILVNSVARLVHLSRQLAQRDDEEIQRLKEETRAILKKLAA